MSRASRRLSALVLLASALGCGAPHRDPSQTVQRYLDAMASDPIRTLTLVTRRFHDAHGLRFEEVGDQPFAGERSLAKRFDDEPLEVERARLGWLTVLTKRFFFIQARRFGRRVVSERIDGDRAEVMVQVEGNARPPLAVPFILVRTDADSPWRIDAVALPEIDDADLAAAFLVAPNAALHRRIEARRRRPAEPAARPHSSADADSSG